MQILGKLFKTGHGRLLQHIFAQKRLSEMSLTAAQTMICRNLALFEVALK
jgi:hypothetical protein